MTTTTTKKPRSRAKAAKPYDSAAGLAAINGNIALIRTNSNAFRQLVQDTIVMITRHAANTGDCTAMARLMNDGLTNWHRRGPICDYVADFSPIRVTFKGGVASAKYADKDDEGQRPPFNINGMEATPFWEHKSLQKDNELPQDIDEVDTTVVKFAEKLARMLKDGKIAPSAVDHTKALIAGIKSTVQTVRSSERTTPVVEAPVANTPAPAEAPSDEGQQAAAMVNAA